MRLPKLHLSPIFSGLLYGASPCWTGPRGGADSHGHSCMAPTNRQVGSQVRVSARNRGASATFGARTCPLASAQVAGGCLHRAPAYDCRSVGMVPYAQTGLHAGLHVVCKRRRRSSDIFPKRAPSTTSSAAFRPSLAVATKAITSCTRARNIARQRKLLMLPCIRPRELCTVRWQTLRGGRGFCVRWRRHVVFLVVGLPR
jgi:hypothetical protein